MFNLINKILNNKKNKAIYLDYASLTPIDKGVIGIMEKYSSEIYANPSSLYGYGLNAKNEIEKAKQSIAKDIKAHSDEIIFTSSGTEANNIAILGSIKALGEDIKGKNILISSIEHSSVIEIALSLKQYGIEVNIIPVDQNGIVDIDFIKEKIDKNTILVSVMMINNEIGSIQPINEIAKIIRHKRKENNTFYPYFHTDACQAPLYKEINMEKLGVDIAWEISENTPAVIQHYREQALAVGYSGDSIINSVMDSVFMALGFIAAWRFPWWVTIGIALFLELFVLYMIRDNLTLNVIGLIHPVQAISDWQAAGGIK
jgi:cystathionine beta-lyase family protein involved in aluminum resistance